MLHVLMKTTLSIGMVLICWTVLSAAPQNDELAAYLAKPGYLSLRKLQSDPKSSLAAAMTALAEPTVLSDEPQRNALLRLVVALRDDLAFTQSWGEDVTSLHRLKTDTENDEVRAMAETALNQIIDAAKD